MQVYCPAGGWTVAYVDWLIATDILTDLGLVAFHNLPTSDGLKGSKLSPAPNGAEAGCAAPARKTLDNIWRPEVRYLSSRHTKVQHPARHRVLTIHNRMLPSCTIQL